MNHLWREDFGLPDAFMFVHAGLPKRMSENVFLTWLGFLSKTKETCHLSALDLQR